MQMRNQLKDSIKTPKEERYSGKITRHDHFDDLTDIDNALNKICFRGYPELGNSGWEAEGNRALPRIQMGVEYATEGEKLNSIFLESMFARVKLVPTATERAERYFEGISQGGSLYDADLGDIPVPVSDPNDIQLLEPVTLRVRLSNPVIRRVLTRTVVIFVSRGLGGSIHVA
ncbi:hypothetical protein LWI28_007038 [Acer negundo]|uniref:Uncharacterized protein n=1 Tax=Acer negundo TaxID=4023 RepID=A0AAD5J3F3_ACENE|nr:hypothetical protein LWI28_007038 [Acer negundo]